MKEIKCLNCAYRVKNEQKEHECRFMPPTLQMLMHPTKGPHLVSMYPRVDPRVFFCGQFQERLVEVTKDEVAEIDAEVARRQAEQKSGPDIVIPKKSIVPPHRSN